MDWLARESAHILCGTSDADKTNARSLVFVPGPPTSLHNKIKATPKHRNLFKKVNASPDVKDPDKIAWQMKHGPWGKPYPGKGFASSSTSAYTDANTDAKADANVKHVLSTDANTSNIPSISFLSTGELSRAKGARVERLFVMAVSSA